MDDDLEEDELLALTLDRGCTTIAGQFTDTSDCDIVCEGGGRTTREGWAEWMARVRRALRRGLLEREWGDDDLEEDELLVLTPDRGCMTIVG